MSLFSDYYVVEKHIVSVLGCNQNHMLVLPRKGHVRHVTHDTL